MNGVWREYRFALVVLGTALLVAIIRPDYAGPIADKSTTFLGEVLAVVPPVMVLMGLLDVWVPRKLVESRLGQQSGPIGALVALFLGTAAAGPIYAAFPIAVTLRDKGARTANVVIFLGTWATIKIPMIMMESSFISLRFALLRLLFTIPCIVLAGYVIEWMVPQPFGDMPDTEDCLEE